VGGTTKRPTIADVADAAGVSKTTVSFAFNRPGRLAPATALRIHDVADSLGYRPHPVARMLANRRTRTIGILTPQTLSVIFENPHFAAFSAGVATAVQASGYGLQFISPVHGSLARGIGWATVDGVIVVGLSPRHREVEHVRRVGLPMVLVDSAAVPDQPSIQIDDVGGAQLAAEHLLSLGHRSVLILSFEPPEGCGGEADVVATRRLTGYQAGFRAAGLRLRDTWVLAAPSTIAGGAAAFHRSWEDGLRPTAVLAMSDAMAVGAMQAAREHGLAVPSDLSVVGFDDIELARFTDPSLTTVHQPIHRKGEQAVEWLIALIDGSRRSMAGERLATRLVVRSSTAPALAAPPRTERG
jgi:DNA-binding LacI/PurR family transcriptional regulator